MGEGGRGGGAFEKGMGGKWKTRNKPTHFNSDMGNMVEGGHRKVDTEIYYYRPVFGDAPYTVVKQVLVCPGDTKAASKTANDLKCLAMKLATEDTTREPANEAGGPLPWMPCLVEISPQVALISKSPPSAPVTDVDVERSMFWLHKASSTYGGENVRVVFGEDPV